MDKARKRTGFAILCGALIILIGTGIAYAANASAGAAQTYNATGINNTVDEITLAEKFAAYEKYGLTHDTSTDNLYFRGELVRYFEDYYPIGDNGIAGIDHFNENGTIDVHAVRDMSQVGTPPNADGSFDPSGKLTGIEPYIKADFDERDIEKLKNPQQATAYSGNPITPDELAKEYSIYEPFGVTYDKTQDRFYYNGKSVRVFWDTMGSNGESLTGGQFSGSMRTMGSADGEIDISTIRDYSELDANGYGKLIGVEVMN